MELQSLKMVSKWSEIERRFRSTMESKRLQILPKWSGIDRRPLDVSSQCYWCVEYIIPPVKRCCECGRDLCSVCGRHYIICPYCFASRWGANKEKDRFLIHNDVMCRYQWCSFKSLAPIVKEHEQNCPFMFLYCPFYINKLACFRNEGVWIAQSKGELIYHLLRMHPKQSTILNSHEFVTEGFGEHWRIGKTLESFFVFVCLDQVFLMAMDCNFGDQNIYLSICYNSEPCYKQGFWFEVKFYNHQKGEPGRVYPGPCRWMGHQAPVDATTLKIPIWQVLDFCVSDKLIFTVTVQPVFQTYSQPEGQTEVQTVVQTEVQPVVQSEVQPVVQTEIQPI